MEVPRIEHLPGRQPHGEREEDLYRANPAYIGRAGCSLEGVVFLVYSEGAPSPEGAECDQKTGTNRMSTDRGARVCNTSRTHRAR